MTLKFESDPSLRTLLHDAIREESEISKHSGLIRRVAAKSPHAVRPLPADDALMPKAPVSEFTCFAFAIDLVDAPSYRKIRRHFKASLHANSDFIKWLIEEGHLKEFVDASHADTAIVVYFNASGEPAHAGVLRGEDVVSKWGTGLLYVHPLAEVPITYGDEYRIYDRLSRSIAEDLFIKFTEVDVNRIPARPNPT